MFHGYIMMDLGIWALIHTKKVTVTKIEQECLLLTAREGTVFTGVCLSTIGLIATRLYLLWHGQYASYWTAFLFYMGLLWYVSPQHHIYM